MENILNAISSVGFPILACVILGTYVKGLTNKMFEVTDKFTTAINNLSNKIDDIIQEVKNNG